MNFENFVTRTDEETIQEIVGRDSIRILNILDTDLTRLSGLQKALLSIYSPIELLSQKLIRDCFFDLLKPDEAENLLILLGKDLGSDNYTKLKSIKFNTSVEFNILLCFFEIPNMDVETIDIAPSSITATTNYPLFIHQREAIKELDQLYVEGNKKALLHMPTGSGKTRTAMNVICNHLRKHEPTVVIWLAHTEELCEQAYQEFLTAWRNIGDRELNTVRFWGSSEEDISSLKDGFIVGGLMKVFNLLKKDASAIGNLGSHTSLIIMDEAHMAIAPTYKTTLEILLNFNALLLGLSATPGRTWNDPSADLELSQFFNRKKITLKIEGFTNPVDYLVENGYLATVDNTRLLYDSGIHISPKDLEYLNEYLELPEKYLKALSEDQARNILIIQKIEELITRHKRIIVFGLNVHHSNLLATCLQVRNVKAFSVTSNTDSLRRKKLIEDFKSNDESSMVLCNYGILTTGFDAPKTSCAVICRPTDSLVLYSQMVGRAIRGKNAGGNEQAEIVTVIDMMLPGFDQVQNAFFNWEDVW